MKPEDTKRYAILLVVVIVVALLFSLVWHVPYVYRKPGSEWTIEIVRRLVQSNSGFVVAAREDAAGRVTGRLASTLDVCVQWPQGPTS